MSVPVDTGETAPDDMAAEVHFKPLFKKYNGKVSQDWNGLTVVK
jgi:hypothetical protein